MTEQKLTFNFYNQPCENLAKSLLGKYLVRHIGEERLIGKIVETEAYLGPHDKAAHTSRGKTNRTQIMFGPAGYTYVYLIYGIHHLLNITAKEEGSAVLIRALQPIAGVEARTNGPGLLTKALEISRYEYGIDLTKSKELYCIDNDDRSNAELITTPRIGVAYAEEWAQAPLRFYLAGNKFVSQK